MVSKSYYLVLALVNRLASRFSTVTTLNQVLVSCQPTSAAQICLENIIKRVTESETLLDRARLFIEPSDLLDGISRMSLSSQPKSKEVDIITKDSIRKRGAWTCLRCGGMWNRTPQGQGAESLSQRWRCWERRWQSHCLCGGSWVCNI